MNDIGQAVQWIWNAMPERFPTVELDQYVIMPNHIHAVIVLQPYEGAMNCAPTLGLILRTFKALCTRYIRATGVSDFAWQRNYHEHITHKEGNLDGIRHYIIDNPICWTKDSLFTE